MQSQGAAGPRLGPRVPGRQLPADQQEAGCLYACLIARWGGRLRGHVWDSQWLAPGCHPTGGPGKRTRTFAGHLRVQGVFPCLCDCGSLKWLGFPEAGRPREMPPRVPGPDALPASLRSLPKALGQGSSLRLSSQDVCPRGPPSWGRGGSNSGTVGQGLEGA